jgi:hypothetical protein
VSDTDTLDLAGFCCLMRKKVMAAPLVLTEKFCGVPDTVLADFVRFDLPNTPVDTNGRPVPVIKWAFCAWCGHRLSDSEPVRIAPPIDIAQQHGAEPVTVIHLRAQIEVSTTNDPDMPVTLRITDVGDRQCPVHILPMSTAATSAVIGLLAQVLRHLADAQKGGDA